MKYARIAEHNGGPAIVIDGVVYPPMTATLLEHDAEYYRELRRAGIKIFFVRITTNWLLPNAVEYLRNDMSILLEAVPDAKCFLRISLDPPLEWIKNHPDEIMRYQDGSHEPFDFYSEFLTERLPGMYFLGSEVWREESAKYLLEFLDELDSTPLSKHIIGYFLGAGACSKWNSGNRLNMWEKNKGAGFSPAFKKTFGKYLREKYGTEENLQKAWRDPCATFENPHIPDMDERFFTLIDELVINQFDEFYQGKPNPHNGFNVGSFLDMDNCAGVMDFMRAYHYGAADSIVYFAQLLKNRDDSKMVGAFYGGYGCTDYFNCGSAGCVLKILDSEAVDYLATPGVYSDRQPGGVTAQRVMQDSFRIRGKIFISEDDTRTHRDGFFYRETMNLYTLKDSVNVLKRDFGRNICEDIYGWWFDHSRTKRYKDTGIYELFQRQQEIASFSFSQQRQKHHEVALIYDEESISLVTQQTSYEICDLFRISEVHRFGLPVDYYFHNDLARSDMPDYKVYIFLNCFYLNNEEREAIITKLKKKNSMAIWIYASGFINPDMESRMDADNISSLTGIRIKMEPDCAFTNFRIEGNHPALLNADPDRIYGNFDRKIESNVWLKEMRQVTYAYPLFTTDDPESQVLGRFCNTGLPALTIKETDGFTSVFCGAKILRADLIQSLARYAGCHVWLENTDDILYANKNFVVLHAASTGRKIIRLPREADAYEVYERRYYCRNSREICFDMKFGETKMFSLCGEC